MLALHNLKSSTGSTKRRKRLGRGSGSGHGNYSTRGMKGQRARSGGKSGLALRSVRSYLLRIPKNRGFRSLATKFAVVNVGVLEENFKAGETVNVRSLHKLGLVNTTTAGLKVLSSGELKKNLLVEANAFSEGAKAKIEAAGGKIKLVKKQKAVSEKVADKK
jgi:large subunit ribosomal protein L15